MDTIFINTENAKTNESNRFRLYFSKELDLRSNKTISLANLSIYYTWENIKSAFNNIKFKISGPTRTETFDLPDGSYEMSDIQNFYDVRGMVIDAFQKGIIPFKKEYYDQCTEEKESNWIMYSEFFTKLNDELDKYGNNFSPTFNLIKVRTKKLTHLK